MTKICNKCNKELDISQFEKWRSSCRKCKADYLKQWRKGNPRKAKEHGIKKLHGISIEEYEEKMSKSNVCEICGTENKLCYDHNHTTGLFRGVLCDYCNKALGGFKDSKHLLSNAIKYLNNNGSYHD